MVVIVWGEMEEFLLFVCFFWVFFWSDWFVVCFWFFFYWIFWMFLRLFWVCGFRSCFFFFCWFWVFRLIFVFFNDRFVRFFVSGGWSGWFGGCLILFFSWVCCCFDVWYFDYRFFFYILLESFEMIK